MMYAYHNQGKVDVRVARIFNTFGPRMHPNDGRVVRWVGREGGKKGGKEGGRGFCAGSMEG